MNANQIYLVPLENQHFLTMDALRYMITKENFKKVK